MINEKPNITRRNQKARKEALDVDRLWACAAKSQYLCGRQEKRGKRHIFEQKPKPCSVTQTRHCDWDRPVRISNSSGAVSRDENICMPFALFMSMVLCCTKYSSMRRWKIIPNKKYVVTCVVTPYNESINACKGQIYLSYCKIDLGISLSPCTSNSEFIWKDCEALDQVYTILSKEMEEQGYSYWLHARRGPKSRVNERGTTCLAHWHSLSSLIMLLTFLDVDGRFQTIYWRWRAWLLQNKGTTAVRLYWGLSVGTYFQTRGV